ncbi:MAG: plastocyanin/azurin family copper-binding protein [Phycisphaerales bacterium]|jgi:plastocyanin|nr:plastocyanin/azurin family copper-binding protein [Phycisphaerales bacterium]
MKKVLLGAVLCAGFAAPASAAVVEVLVGTYYMEPQFPHVEVGDTIRWLWDGGNHDVTSGAFCGDDTGIFYSPLTSGTPSFEWTIPADYDGQVIPYYCSVGNHCVAGNQYGGLLVNVGNTHFVSSNGFAFEPADISVDAGDVVIWIHDGGSHTVTSGSNCTPDGRFDDLFDNLHQMPFYVVPDDEPTGTIDYYCTPHCGMDMTGTIDVSGVCAGDLDGDGTVGVDDLLGLLAAYGDTCTGCPEDINGDGEVGVDDLLELLGVYGTSC